MPLERERENENQSTAKTKNKIYILKKVKLIWCHSVNCHVIRFENQSAAVASVIA